MASVLPFAVERVSLIKLSTHVQFPIIMVVV